HSLPPTPGSVTSSWPPTHAGCSSRTSRATRTCAATGRTTRATGASSTRSRARSRPWTTTDRAPLDQRRTPPPGGVVLFRNPPRSLEERGGGRLPLVPVADRVTALATECTARHLRPGRGLVALPLAHAHQVQHPVDRVGGEPGRGDLLARLLQVDVARQDRIEHVVRRQRILVLLVR